MTAPLVLQRADLERALDFLEAEPERRLWHLVFNGRKPGKLRETQIRAAAAMVEGWVVYADRRPRHLRPGARTMTVASPRPGEAAQTVELARLLASTYVLANLDLTFHPGRHQAPE